MGKNKRYKAIRKIAAELPVVMRETNEKHYRMGSELMADDLKEVGGVPIDPKKIHIESFPVKMAINHHRNLKKLVNKYGPGLIQPYADKVKEIAATQ